ncbi:MAG: DUF177 domain-containing protein [Bacteroidetes bacterium]|nr:DUF177 domain-containing protein [Bacteroidota bacterium]
MSGLYTIPLNGLKEGSYLYEFQVNGDFFRTYEESGIRECELDLVVKLEKVSVNYNLRFHLSGKITVTCDRCLGEYRQAVDSESRLVVKTGESFDDSDPELLIIPAGMTDLNLSQFIYDYSHLALPIRKVHPDGPGGESKCDPDMLKRIAGASGGESGSGPEWDKLKELLNEN